MPFQVACSSHLYLPVPLLANIIVTMARPRNVSKLHRRDVVRSFAAFFRRSSSSNVSDDVDVVVVVELRWERFRSKFRTPFVAPTNNAPMTHTNNNAIQLPPIRIFSDYCRLGFWLFVVLHEITLTGDRTVENSQPELLIVKL